MKARLSEIEGLATAARAYIAESRTLVGTLNSSRGAEQSEAILGFNAVSLGIDVLLLELSKERGVSVSIECLGHVLGSLIAQAPPCSREAAIALFGKAFSGAGVMVDQDRAAIEAAKAGSAGNA